MWPRRSIGNFRNLVHLIKHCLTGGTITPMEGNVILALAFLKQEAMRRGETGPRSPARLIHCAKKKTYRVLYISAAQVSTATRMDGMILCEIIIIRNLP